MAASRPTVLVRTSTPGALRAAAAITLLPVLALGGCDSAPTTVLQTDLPQVPGMTSRESSGLRQAGGVIDAGTFAYKGAIMNLPERVAETKARFASSGWALYSQRETPATARLVFAKGDRRATVEIIRNDIAPGMSTAVTTVETAPATAPPPPAPPAPPPPTPPAPHQQ